MKNENALGPLAMKPHYVLLDGLRGVAALLVLWYHVFEGYAFVNGTAVEYLNHGYLAVDFFFLLSGFVIGYAYDDRWQKMSTGNFFRRRLIRLHPMVIMGTVIGVITFLLQGSEKWDGSHVAFSLVAVAALCQLFLIPCLPGAASDVRGNNEMFPLNGPTWSLFFEYIGNIIYALLLRRLSTRWLTVVVAASGLSLLYFVAADVSGYDMLGIGWSLLEWNFPGGLLRMLFPYSMGLLMSRVFKPVKVRGAFWICSLVLLCLFVVPPFERAGGVSVNALYDVLCICFVFPVLVWIAASSATTDKTSTSVCKFLGDISYPVYVIHYPFMYLFYAWMMKEGNASFEETWPVALLLITGCIFLAFVCLKYYDEPVRKWLGRKISAKM